MSSSSSRLWVDGRPVRLDRGEPYLRLQHVTVFVRDQDESLRFYLNQLGFSLVADFYFAPGMRWVAVAPPDGSAILALHTPDIGSEDTAFIGQSRQITFTTENVEAKYEEWLARGVRFRHAPRTPAWGGCFTTFEDPDGNSFALVGFDEINRYIESERLKVAARLESERRTAQEMEFARQVQIRLFPQRLPEITTLAYAGICIQARQVGGDYYDFLDLGGNKLGLVIGDIAGKGIAAALLMVSLQANLRSQCAIAPDQPVRVLASVNRIFFENTPDSAYATLFYAEYDGNTRRLQYVNCGHLSGVVIRHNDGLERLDSTATVLGLFRQWEGQIGTTVLSPGDIFALFSDGMTESFNEAGDEFGDGRIIDSLRRNRGKAATDVVASVLAEVKQFSPQEQFDDLTLIVGKTI